LATVASEEIQEGVRSTVVALGWSTSHCRNGTDHDEKVERLICQGVVEVPGTCNLGINGIIPAVDVVTGEETILKWSINRSGPRSHAEMRFAYIERHHTLHYTSNGHLGCLDGAKDVLLLTYIALDYLNVHTFATHAKNHGRSLGLLVTRSTKEDQVTGTLLDHLASKAASQTTQTSY
jgi:hypothetical protein